MWRAQTILVSLTQEDLVFSGPGAIRTFRCRHSRSQVKIQGQFSGGSGLKV